MGNFKEDIAKIKAFVFDVDGVFTDGGIVVDANGDFLRKYNAKDGYAVGYALKMGYLVCIITGGRGVCIEKRFNMLGVTRLYVSCMNKFDALKEFMNDYSLDKDQVMFMGDDIPDTEAMAYAGMPVCPSDAVSEVLEISRYVSQYGGGNGCVRDVVEQVLRARGHWAKSADGIRQVASF